MKANTVPAGGTNVFVIALGILAALIVFLALTGRKVPLLSSERAVLLGLVVIGGLMCAPEGIGRVAASGAWWHPLSIVGYVLGAVVVLIGLAALFGRQVPPLTSYHQSIMAVAAIGVLKVVLTAIHRLWV